MWCSEVTSVGGRQILIEQGCCDWDVQVALWSLGAQSATGWLDTGLQRSAR